MSCNLQFIFSTLCSKIKKEKIRDEDVQDELKRFKTICIKNLKKENY